MANSASKPRVLVDANILLSGSAFPRWPYEVLQHAIEGDFNLVLSPLVINQARRHLEKRFTKHLARFENFLKEVEYELIPDPPPEEIAAHQDLVRDLSDVPIALAAITAQVDYIVSEDKDLSVQDETTLELRRHVTVLISGTFLREVMGWSSEALESIRHRTWKEPQ